MRKFMVYALLCPWLAAMASAQITSTSSLSGTVMDPSGAVVPGAKVTVKNNATGAEYVATSSTSGSYTVTNLANGFYRVGA